MNQILDTRLADRTYQPSGATSPIAYAVFLVIALLATPILGIVYAVIVWHNPIVYINAIGTGVFGAALGYLVYPVVKFGHVRSLKMERLFMVGFGLLGLYFSWAAHLSLALNIVDSSSTLGSASFSLSDFFSLVIRPDVMMLYVLELARVGTWGFGSVPINGTMLWVIWLIEAALVFALIFKINRKWSQYPYSEEDLSWGKKIKLKRTMSLHRGVTKFVEGIQDNNLSPLLEAPLGNRRALEFTELVLYTFNRDNSCYGAFFNKTQERDNNGKHKSVYRKVSDFYKISSDQKQEITDHFGVE
ncbi:MAG: hypothetical protein AAFX87_28535 [Bacteroidota bacterium]